MYLHHRLQLGLRVRRQHLLQRHRRPPQQHSRQWRRRPLRLRRLRHPRTQRRPLPAVHLLNLPPPTIRHQRHRRQSNLHRMPRRAVREVLIDRRRRPQLPPHPLHRRPIRHPRRRKSSLPSHNTPSLSHVRERRRALFAFLNPVFYLYIHSKGKWLTPKSCRCGPATPTGSATGSAASPPPTPSPTPARPLSPQHRWHRTR